MYSFKMTGLWELKNLSGPSYGGVMKRWTRLGSDEQRGASIHADSEWWFSF